MRTRALVDLNGFGRIDQGVHPDTKARSEQGVNMQGGVRHKHDEGDGEGGLSKPPRRLKSGAQTLLIKRYELYTSWSVSMAQQRNIL